MQGKLLTTSALVCIIIICAPTADAWWCSGHMVVSDVARQVIEEKVPSLNRKIEAILRAFTASGPWPANNDQTQISCWADDIKGNLGAMDNWHYITKAYNPTNIPGVPDATTLAGKTNVVTQLDSTFKSLKNKPNVWEAGFSLAWVTHLMGDIHQPCHTTTLYDQAFPLPLGDVGGNFFDIVVNGHKNKLHKYWDSACETLGFDFERPLNAAQSKNISDIALSFMQKFGPEISESERKVFNPASIANVSHELAIEFAYANNSLKPKASLSAEYQSNCRYIAHRQITLGGYRLANQLIYLLNNTEIIGLDMVNTPSPAGSLNGPEPGGLSGGASFAIVLVVVLLLSVLAGGIIYYKKKFHGGEKRAALAEGERLEGAESTYGAKV